MHPLSLAAVDFSPITTHLIEIGAGILAIFGTWALNSLRAYLDAKWGLKNSELADNLQQRANEYILRSIAAAQGVAQAELGKAVSKVDLHNFIAEMGAKYFVDHWPDLSNDLGLSPEKIAGMIKARLTTSPEAEAVREIVIAKAAAPKSK